MNIIAAVDKHWAIGNRGKLLVTIPDDQKLFREETKGKVIVMGRKTLESHWKVFRQDSHWQDEKMWSSREMRRTK